MPRFDAVAMIAIARQIVVIAALLMPLTGLLSACASSPSQEPGNQRASGYAPDGTIVVSNEHSALARGLRQALSQRGWQLVDYRGDLNHSGRDYRAMAKRAKYRLTLTDTPVSPCRNGDPGYRYRIAMIQNAGGQVPVALSGANCLTTILNQFATDLDQNGLASGSQPTGSLHKAP